MPFIEIRVKNIETILKKLRDNDYSALNFEKDEVDELIIRPNLRDGIFVYQSNKAAVEKILREYLLDEVQRFGSVDANTLAENLGIERAHLSALLNHLCRLGYLKKKREKHTIYFSPRKR